MHAMSGLSTAVRKLHAQRKVWMPKARQPHALQLDAVPADCLLQCSPFPAWLLLLCSPNQIGSGLKTALCCGCQAWLNNCSSPDINSRNNGPAVGDLHGLAAFCSIDCKPGQQ